MDQVYQEIDDLIKSGAAPERMTETDFEKMEEIEAIKRANIAREHEMQRNTDESATDALSEVQTIISTLDEHIRHRTKPRHLRHRNH